ncbi:sarcosine oxidase subunit gamma [Agrobacterium vitis]|uniref:Sarcosine oxidase subunit gamma n=1 Tax=Agrobacterium vitis TaxID=373 RepID=A0A6L6VLZ0_AGRVI|nr:sarcosine oxidase subunit gamma [Agrobacterium vitis]MUZ75898.1 sarcosine oxidase subunit gamma [Agrobacterium vitis]
MDDRITAASIEITSFDCGILQLEGWAHGMDRFEAILSTNLGGVLPSKVGDSSRCGSWNIVRIAPRRFWLLCDGEPPAIEIDDEIGCMLWLGDGRRRLRLAGQSIKHVLERCVPIDWDTLSEGKAIQTGFHRVPILLLRTGLIECDLFVPRTFGQSLTEWISDTSRPFH